jgi:phosphinothricin acetyltransferase
MIIRPAVDADLDAILAIYNAAILETAAIWTDDPVDRADREEWFAAHAAEGAPILVAEVDGVAVAYASYSQWRNKYGFRFSVENSIYVASGYQGRGIARALMNELIVLARGAGMHLMVADIEAGNVASIRLHESLGFEKTAHVREIGFKFGRWLDLAILQLTLDAE